MSYGNYTGPYAGSKFSYVPQEPSIFSKVYTGISKRVANSVDLLRCALETVSKVKEIAIGLVATPFAAAISLVSDNDRLVNVADKTNKSDLLLSDIFDTVILILNPYLHEGESNDDKNDRNYSIAYILKHVSDKFLSAGADYAYGENFFKRHVIARVIFMTAIPALLVAGIADLALAIIPVAITVITFGKVKRSYEVGFTQLKGVKAIDFASKFFRMMINPKLSG